MTLLNGDRLVANSAPGMFHASEVPGILNGGAASTVMLHMGERIFVIPIAAVPYIGHGLGPSLFELTALQRVERVGQCRSSSATGAGCTQCWVSP
jgi:hypothetical protein